jgi:hypothetical protein
MTPNKRIAALLIASSSLPGLANADFIGDLGELV